MTKYYSQQSPASPEKPDKHDDPDKPVNPRPFDPEPSPGDPIVDPADEPLLPFKTSDLRVNKLYVIC